MEIRTVAFIGVGSMGAPMARRVMQAGFELTVCDRNPAVLASFEAQGARVTMSARDCGAADVIVVLVGNDAQINDVTIGADGLVHGVDEGRAPVVCVMSTTLPGTLQAIAPQLSAAGARLIDAPISGGIVKAEDGTLTIMLGGASPDIDAVMPVMHAMGQNLFRCGELGSAEVVKVVNNMLCIATMFLTAEAIDLAERHGVKFEQIAPIVNVSTGRNFLTVDAAEARRQYGAWARSEQAFGALVKVVSKDLHLARDMAASGKLDLGLLDEVSRYVDAHGRSAMDQWMRHGGVR
ncbi:3-hydroxyisobutyrate dehydrogenase [Caballeronia calidae]|uniref:3-hydroxyisobutyrate dehydrogenase n=1 Tax=Caballeronia calidae TaxID=1777139 RepID=A0A158DZL8_9BURK|nr:NAD(P)-dependent oxidoreductase [Caballeronia calidae]SAL00062.1 3-hydroxyisobutyrate dehydrogenase [Caballeronia calidae]